MCSNVLFSMENCILSFVTKLDRKDRIKIGVALLIEKIIEYDFDTLNTEVVARTVNLNHLT